MYVRKPSYTSASRTLTIQCNSDYTAQPAASAEFGSQAVWQDYVAVYGLREAPNNDAGGYKDSTGNGYHATGNSMSLTGSTSAIGLPAAKFDGGSDRIDVPAAVFSSALKSSYTVSACAYVYSVASDSRLMSASSSNQSHDRKLVFWMDADGAGDGWAAQTARGGSQFTIGTDNNEAKINAWQSVAAITASSYMRVVVDGISREYTGLSDSGTSTGSTDVYIGAYVPGDSNFHGIISDVRVTALPRTVSFLATEHANTLDLATFWTQGSVS